MIPIVVASQNPVKATAVQNGFQRMFADEVIEITTISVPSNVSDQPFSDSETLQGAINRAQNAAQVVKNADFWVGIEGGIEKYNGQMSAFAWVVVKSNTMIGKGRTGTFYLPPMVADLIKGGKELGEADDIVFNESNSKEKNGAIGILTGDVITRTQLYEHAVILALVPIKNSQLYRE